MKIKIRVRTTHPSKEVLSPALIRCLFHRAEDELGWKIVRCLLVTERPLDLNGFVFEGAETYGLATVSVPDDFRFFDLLSLRGKGHEIVAIVKV